MVPMSLFDQYQMMRKSDKAALGSYLKNINQSTLKSCSFTIPLVIDGGWLIHQLSSFKGCDNYGEVAMEYLKLIPKNREVTVIFDGYEPSTKDHEHKRRIKAFCANIAVKKSTFCTVTKTTFLSNNNNKTELIDLISSIFTVNGIEVIRACNDADTLIAKKTLEMSFHGDVELKAEDTDIVCLLVHHFNSDHHNDIYLTTKKGTYSIKEISSHLDHKEKEILLLIHSISGCDSVSGLFGFSSPLMSKVSWQHYFR